MLFFGSVDCCLYLWEDFFTLIGMILILIYINLKETLEQEAWQCDQCDFSTKSRRRLWQHKLIIHLGIDYKCEECNISFSSKGNLKKHKQRMHSDERFLCDKCDYSASIQENLKAHVERVHFEKIYSCDFCRYKAGTQYLIKNHILKSHAKRETVTCDECDYTTTRKADLKKHKQRKHKRFLNQWLLHQKIVFVYCNIIW